MKTYTLNNGQSLNIKIMNIKGDEIKPINLRKIKNEIKKCIDFLNRNIELLQIISKNQEILIYLYFYEKKFVHLSINIGSIIIYKTQSNVIMNYFYP